MGEKLILIDGHSILNRAFYGVPDLTNAEGIHTNAMYGFLNILFKFLDEEKPDYITVAFDLSAPTFRHKAFDGYKGTRKPMQPELKQQVPLMKELLKAMNITVVEQEGYEADDILGTIAKESAAKGIDVSIVSGDRDLLQLADEHIKIRIPKTKKGVTEVEDYYPSVGRSFFKERCSHFPLRKRMPIEKSGRRFSARIVTSSIRMRIIRFFSFGVDVGAFQISGIFCARSRMSCSSFSEGIQAFLELYMA